MKYQTLGIFDAKQENNNRSIAMKHTTITIYWSRIKTYACSIYEE